MICSGPDGATCHGTAPGSGDPCAPNGCPDPVEADPVQEAVDEIVCRMNGGCGGRKNELKKLPKDDPRVKAFLEMPPGHPCLSDINNVVCRVAIELAIAGYDLEIIQGFIDRYCDYLICLHDFWEVVANGGKNIVEPWPYLNPMEAGAMAFGGAGTRVGGVRGGRVGGCSFDGDSGILMADGTIKPIKDVKVGDVVLATDPETGETAPRSVTALHRHLDSHLVDIVVMDTGGTTLALHSTAGHPFWSVNLNRWVLASDLRPGDLLLVSTGGSAHVAAVQTFVGATVMYNLSVHDIRTYYVLAGDVPVLVHNEGGPSGVVVRGANGMEISIYANDHGPPHAHLKGRGFDIQIGQNGKPLDPNVNLNRAQQQFVDDNLGSLRNQLRKKMAEFDRNHPRDPVTGKRVGC